MRVRCSGLRLMLIIAASAIFYCEYLSHWLCVLRWHRFKYSDDQVRLLFVADPQLVGLRDESETFGFITRWDLDRYLEKTFLLALRHMQPDAVIFLGDLIDEGTKASEEEYASYLKRFHSIFQSSVPHIFIPGDNDVGGEGVDFKEEWKVRRFNLNFYGTATLNASAAVKKVKFIDFLLLNWDFGRAFDGNTKRFVQALSVASHSKFRVLLNHMGIISRSRSEVMPLLKTLKTNVIAVAHTHEARLYSCSDCFDDSNSFHDHLKREVFEVDTFGAFDLTLNNPSSLSEIMVPTCSYRMGVPEMGYGAATIDSSGAMKYSVLWTPGRLPQLFILSAAGTLIVIIAIFKSLILLLSNRKPFYAVYSA